VHSAHQIDFGQSRRHGPTDMVSPHAGEIDPDTGSPRQATARPQRLESALAYPFRATLADDRATLLGSVADGWRIREYWRSALCKLMAAAERGGPGTLMPRLSKFA